MCVINKIGNISSDKNVIFDPDVSTSTSIHFDVSQYYRYSFTWAFNIKTIHRTEQNATEVNKKAVLSQGEPCDAAINFDRYRIFNGIVRAVSLSQHGFLVGLCLQTAVNNLSKSKMGDLE